MPLDVIEFSVFVLVFWLCSARRYDEHCDSEGPVVIPLCGRTWICGPVRDEHDPHPLLKVSNGVLAMYF